jgi:hypothetical protein
MIHGCGSKESRAVGRCSESERKCKWKMVTDSGPGWGRTGSNPTGGEGRGKRSKVEDMIDPRGRASEAFTTSEDGSEVVG